MVNQNIRMLSRVLFNPAFSAGACVVFIVLCAFLIIKRKTLTAAQKIPMIVGIVICLLYFAFLTYGIFFAGSSAH